MLSKMYVRSSIIKKKGLYIAEIVYSWFGLQYYSEFEFFENIEDAKNYILTKRTNGTLVIDEG
jgi:hypothetical protein